MSPNIPEVQDKNMWQKNMKLLMGLCKMLLKRQLVKVRWLELKTILEKVRCWDVIDQHHGISLITQWIQRRHERVATYGNRKTQVAEEIHIRD